MVTHDQLPRGAVRREVREFRTRRLDTKDRAETTASNKWRSGSGPLCTAKFHGGDGLI